MSNLLEKASIITTPTAYSDGVLHSVKPSSPTSLDVSFTNSNNWNWDGSILSASPAAAQTNFTNDIFLEKKTYIITFKVLSYVSGNLGYRFGGGAIKGSYFNSELIEGNTITLEVQSDATVANFQFLTNNFNGSLSDITFTQLPAGDFTFIRNDVGTRVNASGNIESVGVDLPRINYEGFSYQDILGSELVTNGDFVTNNDWTLESGWSISNGKLVGTLSNSTNAFQEKTLEAGKEYKITYEITNYTQGGVRFQFVGGSTVNGLNRNSLGTYTEYLTATDNHNRIRFRSLTTDGGFTGLIDNVSVKEVIGQEVVPNTGCGSWLLEPEATNTATDSNDFTRGYMFNTITGNPSLDDVILTSAQATSPDGTNNAWKFVDDNNGGTGTCGIPYYAQRATAGNYNTVSLFVKKQGNNDWFYHSLSGWGAGVNGNTWFDIANGTLGNVSNSNHTASIDDYGNGWYRCSITFQATTDLQGSIQFRLASSNGAYNVLRDGTNGVYIYGLQAESHATRQYATSYIATSGSPETRAADLAIDAGSSDLISSTEGVLYLEVAALNSINRYESIALSDGGVQNRIRFQFLTSLNSASFQVQVGGVSQAYKSFVFTDITNFNKIAIKYKQNDFSVWLNGVKIYTDTSAAVPTLNQLNFSSGSNFNSFNGKVKCVAVFKEALTDTELEDLTTI